MMWSTGGTSEVSGTKLGKVGKAIESRSESKFFFEQPLARISNPSARGAPWIRRRTPIMIILVNVLFCFALCH